MNQRKFAIVTAASAEMHRKEAEPGTGEAAEAKR